mmetsp:Transcript_11049/g.30757  ORF Transcript_11049/g.30757 Transcript_11049/m.30757 type:complete len:313 (+) Transcript_11049:31-969(+)
MPLTLGVRWNGKTCKISLEDGASAADLLEAIERECGVERSRQQLKGGFPPKPIDVAAAGEGAKVTDLGLRDRDSLVLTEAAIPIPSGASPSAAAAWRHTVTAPASVGELERLVVPADNSCLFTAIRSALQLTERLTSDDLRRIVKEKILSDPANFDPFCLAVSEKDSAAYADWIMQGDSWGGAIETQILADYFGVQICSLSIQRGAENPPCPEEPVGDARIYLLYDDGVHYDVIMTGQPANNAGKSGCFSVKDEVARAKAHVVAKDLKERKQYTDAAGCSVQCMVCFQKFVGFKEAAQHGKETGHQNLVQIG